MILFKWTKCGNVLTHYAILFVTGTSHMQILLCQNDIPYKRKSTTNAVSCNTKYSEKQTTFDSR